MFTFLSRGSDWSAAERCPTPNLLQHAGRGSGGLIKCLDPCTVIGWRKCEKVFMKKPVPEC